MPSPASSANTSLPVPKEVLVLCPGPVWPTRNGYAMAVHSDMAALAALGCNITLATFVGGDDEVEAPPFDGVEIATLPYSPGGRPRRLLRSFLRRKPAAWERYYSTKAHVHLNGLLSSRDFDLVLLEDIPMSAYGRALAIGGTQVVLRLQNVQAEIIDGLARRGGALGCMLSIAEQRRVSGFERRAVTSSMPIWCICQRDAEILRQRYGCTRPDVLGVCVNRPDLLALQEAEGSKYSLVHIGSVDLKKKPGFEVLLATLHRLIQANPSFRLLVAGHHTVPVKGLHASGVVHLGRVRSDASVFRQGRFFINPQTVSGGIKLKSICALLAGRTLISTDVGVEGLELRPNEHFVPFNNADDLYRVVSHLIEHDSLALHIARKGREAAERMFSRYRADMQLACLLEKLSTGADL